MKDNQVGQSVQTETQSKEGGATKLEKGGSSRRKFLGRAGTATAAMAAASVGVLGKSAKALTQAPRMIGSVGAVTTQPDGASGGNVNPQSRRQQSYNIRQSLAATHRRAPLPAQITNGDNNLYPDKATVFTKCLVHDDFGRVDLVSSYPSYINALNSGLQTDFESIILGSGGRTLNDPQGGLCYQLDGGDTAAFAAPPAPTIAGTEEAAEMVELYWAAQLRDHEFNNYDNDSLAQAAAAEINNLPGYVGPRNSSGQVTTKELFRGGFAAQPNYFPGELTGPYVSQFAILPTFFGAQPISQQWQVFLPGADYMTDAPAQGFAGSNWLNVQNGAQISTLPQVQFDPVYRYPRNGRDWSAMTHVDLPPQEAFVALLVLLGIGAPVNPGSPYAVMKADNGVNAFGGPDFSSLVGQVAACALDVIWYSKWQVHLRHRPEVTGALAHLILTGQGAETDVTLDSSLLNSRAIHNSFSQYGTYLLPQAFPEGSPVHPDYPAWHLGRPTVTVLKFLFDGNFVIPNPMMVEVGSNGLTLVPYTGPSLTVNGELNKLAHNISFGHGIHAGIHFRSATDQSLLLGETFALSALQDKAECYNERFTINIQKFDGTTATISNNGGAPTQIG